MSAHGGFASCQGALEILNVLEKSQSPPGWSKLLLPEDTETLRSFFASHLARTKPALQGLGQLFPKASGKTPKSEASPTGIDEINQISLIAYKASAS